MNGRKYERGEQITRLSEFAEQEFIWDSRCNKVYNRGWFGSWQFRYIKTWINRGVFFKAKPIRGCKGCASEGSKLCEYCIDYNKWNKKEKDDEPRRNSTDSKDNGSKLSEF